MATINHNGVEYQIKAANRWNNLNDFNKGKLKPLFIIINHWGDDSLIDFETLKANIAEKQTSVENFVATEFVPAEDDHTYNTAYGYWKYFYYYVVTNMESGKTFYVLPPETGEAIDYRDWTTEFGDYGGVVEAKSGADVSEIQQSITNNIENNIKNDTYFKTAVANLATSNLASTLKTDSQFIGSVANELKTSQELIETLVNSLKDNETLHENIALSTSLLEKLAVRLIDYMHLNGVDFTYAPNLARVTIIDSNGKPVELNLSEENGVMKATADLNGRYTIQLSTRTNV